MNRNSIFTIIILGLLGMIISIDYVTVHRKEADRVNELSIKLNYKKNLVSHSFKTISEEDIFNSDDDDIVWLLFEKDSLTKWTDKHIGIPNIKDKLDISNGVIEINNVYYYIQKDSIKADKSIYALIKIKEQYPYNTNSLKDKFADFLQISTEDASKVRVGLFPFYGGSKIQDKSGETLFYIKYDKGYHYGCTNYIFIIVYILFSFILFIFYEYRMRIIKTVRKRSIFMFLFGLLLIIIRFLMYKYKIPASLYSMNIFSMPSVGTYNIHSIGDFFISSYFLIFFLYITHHHIRKNISQIEISKKYNYLFIILSLLVVIIFVYDYDWKVEYIINELEINLNIAKVFNVSNISLISFISLMMLGLSIIYIINISVLIICNMENSKQIIIYSVAVLTILLLVSTICGIIAPISALFLMILFIVIYVNVTFFSTSIKRSIYIFVVLLFSIFFTIYTKGYEEEREIKVRKRYAQTLIEERDYIFERNLHYISRHINDSDMISELIKNNMKQDLQECLSYDRLNITGVHYNSKLYVYDLEQEQEDNIPVSYFNKIISDKGIRLGTTNFYYMDIYDGITSYIGRFQRGNSIMFLRFDSNINSEGGGYPELMSRRSLYAHKDNYAYSYAKYNRGNLMISSGNFSYPRFIKDFSRFKDGESFNRNHYSHFILKPNENDFIVVSLSEGVGALYYLNIVYSFFFCGLLTIISMILYSDIKYKFRGFTLKSRIKNYILSIILSLFIMLIILTIYINYRALEKRIELKVTETMSYINKDLEHNMYDNNLKATESLLTSLSELLKVDINIYKTSGELYATSRRDIFKLGIEGTLMDYKALDAITKNQDIEFFIKDKIGELYTISAYSRLSLSSGKSYILHIPYFPEKTEFNNGIITMIIIAVNISIFLMIIAYIISGIVSEHITKPLQVMNEKLRDMSLVSENKKIDYDRNDEFGTLVKAYNDTVDKLKYSVDLLAKKERDGAWREMAQQIAHEIKNPLTPMRLNIQFMQKIARREPDEDFREIFKDYSNLIIDQIDNMSSIASVFSDFAKLPEANSELINLSELVTNATKLFENTKVDFVSEITKQIMVYADKEQLNRVLINLLKNAEQSIPEDKQGLVKVVTYEMDGRAIIKVIDNGIGIKTELLERIFEPKFTTKSKGTGLGLAISRKIIESMGGEIYVKSELDKGSEFKIVMLLPQISSSLI